MDKKAIYAAGLERGEENGKKEKSLEIAKELLNRGIPKEEVAKIVHLDIKEIENI